MPKIRPGPEQRTPWAAQDNTLKGPWSFRTKEKVICMCEGGGFCDRENPAKQKGKAGNAIPGLHSSWVGKQRSILAMARPWQEYVHKYHLVDAFLKNNIGMILNLQEVGEHASCGPGNLTQSGFTYDPETFMAARIGVYNFSWRDMGVPDLDKMMDIVQVMEYVTVVEGRRIAVHCHAGLGRTGLAIACFLVYSQQYSARRAVEETRRDRQGALQTNKQELFVYVFEQYCAHLRCLFLEPSCGSAVAPCDAPQPCSTSDFSEPSSEVKQKSVHETHASGLVVVRAIRSSSAPPASASFSGSGGSRPSGSSSSSSSGSSAGQHDAMTSHELGLDHALPWSSDFNIVPEMFDKAWTPRPPTSYQGAMTRQQRLLHGTTRRAYLHLHRFVAEAVLALIGAAQAHVPPVSALAAAPAAPAMGPPPLQTRATPPLPPSAVLPPAAPGTQQLQPVRDVASLPALPALSGRISAASLPPMVPASGSGVLPSAAAIVSEQQRVSGQKAQRASDPRVSEPGSKRTSGRLPLQPQPVPAAQAVAEGCEWTIALPAASGCPLAESSENCTLVRNASQLSSGGERGTWGGIGRRSHRRVCPGPVSESVAPGGAAAVGPQGPGLPAATCFAEAWMRCADGAMRSKPGTLEALSRQPGYARFTGSQATLDGVSAAAHTLQQQANFGDYSSLSSAPVAVLVLTLEQLLGRLTRVVPALSEATMRCARDHYQTLPYEVDANTPEPDQFFAASSLLDPLPAPDQELLLLFASLLRHLVRASGGAGCEEHVKGATAWVLRMLVGPQLQKAPAEANEAMTCFMWYLIRNDVAYGTLVLGKQRRLNGQTKQGLAASLKHARAGAPPDAYSLGHDPVAGLMLPTTAPRTREEAVSVTSLDNVPMMPTPQPHQVMRAAADGYPPQQQQPQQQPYGGYPHDTQQFMSPPPPGSILSPGSVPPSDPPPPHALRPAPAGPGVLLAGPTPSGRAGGLVPLAPTSSGPGAAVLLQARGLDGQLDPRLYGAGAGALGTGSGRLTPLKEQLSGVPTAYIPAPTPGTQEAGVHDVWI